MTWFISFVSVAESFSDITRPRVMGDVSRSPTDLTTRGWTSTPPLSIAEKACASWIGVTATPWPKAPLARSIWRHGVTLGSRTRPPTSLATSMPDGSPKPSVRHSSNSRTLEAFRSSCGA